MVRDTWLVFVRTLRLQLREPVWVVIGITQPILYLVLFGPLLETLGGGLGFGDTDPWLVFAPGMLVLLALMGAGFAGFGILGEKREGVVERMRITPASRSALLLGRVASSVVTLLVQALALLLVAVLAFGVRPDPLGVVLVLALVAVVAAALSALSYALGLASPDESTLASVLNMVTLPVLLLSGVLLPMSLAPGWLETLSRFNPMTHVVEGARDLFIGDLATGSVALGGGLAVLIAVLAAVVGTRTFQRTAG